MSNIWSQQEEGERLGARFAELKARKISTQARFAREFDFPGGSSMVNQQIKGLRPISLTHAKIYACFFKCKIEEISPRAALELAELKEPIDVKDGDEDSQLGPLLPAPYQTPNGTIGEKTVYIGTPEELAKLGFDTSMAGGAAQKKAATLTETLDRLGDLLATASPKTRGDVAALLASYARDPSEGKRLAQAIDVLLKP